MLSKQDEQRAMVLGQVGVGLLGMTEAAAPMAWKQEGSAAPISDVLSETLLVEAVQIDNFLGAVLIRLRTAPGRY